MKTAYELAIERLGGTDKPLTEAQKEKLAEIDREIDAKVAETRIRSDAELKAADGDADKEKELREQLAEDLARLEDKRETAKNAVREGK